MYIPLPDFFYTGPNGIVSIIVFIFWIWMLIDCVQKQKKNQILWFLLIFFLPLIGALIYFIVCKLARKR